MIVFYYELSLPLSKTGNLKFIDFEKVFDRVWRDGLFHKLLLNNINGKMYNILFNMYSSVKNIYAYNILFYFHNY
jgi:hypothetical protein